ncbi:hypothetical protein [Ideonella sp.]|uniref:hypothetical protein n=1 Tax=Ideonella sp. TaxID=1929293 RepID=UPI0035B267FC
MKKNLWRRPGLLAACALGVLQVACAAPPAPPAPKSAPADTTALSRQIREQIGDAACTANEQCHTIAIGHKACGGPETYAVWSSAVSDGKKLRELADAYTQARKQEAEQSGRVSDCSLVTDPGARCEAGRCVPAGRSPAVM